MCPRGGVSCRAGSPNTERLRRLPSSGPAASGPLCGAVGSLGSGFPWRKAAGPAGKDVKLLMGVSQAGGVRESACRRVLGPVSRCVRERLGADAVVFPLDSVILGEAPE